MSSFGRVYFFFLAAAFLGAAFFTAFVATLVSALAVSFLEEADFFVLAPPKIRS